MVEPLFRFDGELAENRKVLLDGDEGHHAVSVRRMRVGEPISLTNGRGLRARGTVTRVDRRELTVEIASVEQEPEPSPRYILIQAIAKGDRDELAVQAATELGVARIVPWQSDRSVSRWDGKEAKGRERWQSIADEAAKQSLRAWFPEVTNSLTSKGLCGFVKDLTSQGAQVLVLDPTAESGLGHILDLKVVPQPSTAIIVGPEGGITNEELLEFEAAGAERVHLGSGILRTSTAGVAALSALIAGSGAWR
ncbi:MAG: hypothetical protein RIS80_1169 [Actinomycetota bacterium]|jgi:16S rRNA (uracil1498-N3)-methyltransferase